MTHDPDRPFGRDVPIILGVHPCPTCGEYVSTEFVDADEDKDVKQIGDAYYHAGCAPEKAEAPCP